MIAKESPTTETEAVPSHIRHFLRLPVDARNLSPTTHRFRD
jgi:hypothetical protein